MIVRKNDNTKPCSSCAHNRAGTCAIYQSEVTGSDAPITDARVHCRGTDWEQRQSISAIVNESQVTTPSDAFATDQHGNKYFADRIVKPDGTIVHTETPNKLYE